MPSFATSGVELNPFSCMSCSRILPLRLRHSVLNAFRYPFRPCGTECVQVFAGKMHLKKPAVNCTAGVHQAIY